MPEAHAYVVSRPHDSAEAVAQRITLSGDTVATEGVMGERTHVLDTCGPAMPGLSETCSRSMVA